MSLGVALSMLARLELPVFRCRRLLPLDGLYCSTVVRFGVSVAAPVSREGRSMSGGER